MMYYSTGVFYGNKITTIVDISIRKSGLLGNVP